MDKTTFRIGYGLGIGFILVKKDNVKTKWKYMYGSLNNLA